MNYCPPHVLAGGRAICPFEMRDGRNMPTGAWSGNEERVCDEDISEDA